MLQGQIAFGKAELVGAFVQPAGMVVASALGVEAGKNPRGTFFGVAKIFAQNARGVGVMRDVIVEKQVVSMTCRIRPPRKAMSLPARMGAHMSASALVRENRGSTWMMVAPRSFAIITQRKPTGCASAIEEPWIKIQSALARSCCAVVAPPRPNEAPRPGTVLLCHIRAWLDTHTIPRPRVNSFRMR